MKLLPHIAASTIAGASYGIFSGHYETIPVVMAAGILPDVDHVFDFYWHYVRKSRKRLFILFHGWEFYLALIVVTWFTQNWWIGAVASGYFTQLLLDQLGNKAKWNTYFFTWRAWNRFRRQESYGSDSPGFYKALTDSLPWVGPKMVPWFEAREREMYPEAYQE